MKVRPETIEEFHAFYPHLAVFRAWAEGFPAGEFDFSCSDNVAKLCGWESAAAYMEYLARLAEKWTAWPVECSRQGPPDAHKFRLWFSSEGRGQAAEEPASP